MNTRLMISAAVLGAGLCIPISAAAQDSLEGLTPERILGYLGFKGNAEKKLLAGEIITTGRKDIEKDEDELAAAVVMVVKSPMAAVANSFRRGDTMKLDRKVLDYGVIADGKGSLFKDRDGFEGLSLAASEAEEARLLLEVEPGDQFNLSDAEMARFRKLKSRNMADNRLAATVSRVYREILEVRYRKYRESGVRSIAPYVRSKDEKADPGEQLKLASSTLARFKEHFPRYHGALLEFPEKPLDPMEHVFLWLKTSVEDRPTFVLSHWCGVETKEYVLITERQFYVGHTYDCLQVQIGLFPHAGGTIVCYMNRTFTEKVAGFGSGIKKGFGRDRIASEVENRFRRLRRELEKS